MSIRHGVLALLAERSRYGYELRVGADTDVSEQGLGHDCDPPR